MRGQQANAAVNEARALLMAALGLEGAVGWEVSVTADAVTPDPGQPVAGRARELLLEAFEIPEGRGFLVIVRPGTATFYPSHAWG